MRTKTYSDLFIWYVHLGSKYLVRAQAKQQGQKCVWVSIKLNIHLGLNHV